MKQILGSAALIIALGAAVSAGTGAFFSDSETSSGNTFAAGLIDLLIDNESYYNGNVCVDTNGEAEGGYVWQGNAAYPVPGTECETSFPASNLDEGLLFFNFTDLKPDDEGEDTISIHVQNDAWMCMDVTLTSNDDASSTEPELGDGDAQDIVDATWDGELAQNIQFVWWADDGDNVLEEGENLLTDGVETLAEMTDTGSSTFSVPLADTDDNVWDPENPGPIPANETVYIAKAWCFGTLTLDPVEDNGGVNPSVDPGVECDGTLLDNVTQTDSATLDVAFRAVQARSNTEFNCEEEEVRTATLTVVKHVINDNGGNNATSSFQLVINNGVLDTLVTTNIPTNVSVGTYEVSELGAQGYEATFSGDCDVDGKITLAEGDNKTCIITNDDLPANITLIKNVVGGSAVATTFTMRIDGGAKVPTGSSKPVTSNTNHVITEDAFAGYHFTSITGAGCPANLATPFMLDEGVSITCTITNTAN